MPGFTLGTVVTLPICGVIADNIGWEAVFYVTGGVAFVFSLIWFWAVHDAPGQHPKISQVGEALHVRLSSNFGLSQPSPRYFITKRIKPMFIAF